MKKFLLMLLILLLPIWAEAATYYVAQTAAGGEDGTTYNDRASVDYHDAKSGVFADLAGHTVYLCDSISSTLDVAVSGTSGSRITYRGDLADHALDYDGGAGDCIQLNGYDYISLINLTLTGGRDGITTYSGSSTGIIIQGCSISGMSGAVGCNAIYGQFINSIIGGESGKGNTIFDIEGNDSGDADISLSGVTNGVLISHNLIYGNGTTTGGDGIVHVGAENVLIEYNKIYDHCREDAVDIKESENIIVRYNDLYGNHDKGVQVQFRCQDVYIYGNRIHDNGESGIWMRDADDIAPTLRRIHIWSNLIYGNTYDGIGITNPPYDGEYGEITGPINIIGNTIYNNVTSQEVSSNAGVRVYAAYSPDAVVNIINNIFYNNRHSEGSDKTRQIYIDAAHTGVGETTIENNRFYSTDGSALIYWGASGDVAPGTVDASNNVGDPGLTNVAAGDFTISVGGSAAVSDGVDYSGLVGSVTITSPVGTPTVYNMYYDTALGPTTDWSTLSVATLEQDSFGDWETGAYVYVAAVWMKTISGVSPYSKINKIPIADIEKVIGVESE